MSSLFTLVFASSNAHKLKEIRALLPPGIHVQGLADIGWEQDIPEPHDTFEENAATKAATIFRHLGIPCFAEDSGLEIVALDGRPGVMSARYAGKHGDTAANISKVLAELNGRENRSARFIAVIAYALAPNDIRYFKGIVEGQIATTVRGESGFGYDPVFIPAGFNQTFGELPASIKQSISHRKKAFEAFTQFLATGHP